MSVAAVRSTTIYIIERFISEDEDPAPLSGEIFLDELPFTSNGEDILLEKATPLDGASLKTIIYHKIFPTYFK